MSRAARTKGSVEDGGWSIFLSDWTDAKLGNPLGVPFFLANGDKAWFGWPKNEEYENLRGKWSDVDTLAGGQALARKMQGIGGTSLALLCWVIILHPRPTEQL
ncbi:hypothetical protein [Sinorhizobium meliloti]|uniref:hypothetical protein n=1 Tax=Rhizobium meliloti TaxID=382 RepID=UPI003988D3CD